MLDDPADDTIIAILAERRDTHGLWREQAALAYSVRRVLQTHPRWRRLPPFASEAIDHIVTKISRAIAGEWEHKDHWIDICGYSQLAVLEIEKDIGEVSTL